MSFLQTRLRGSSDKLRFCIQQSGPVCHAFVIGSLSFSWVIACNSCILHRGCQVLSCQTLASVGGQVCEVFQQPFLDIEALHQVTASEQELQAAGIKEGVPGTIYLGSLEEVLAKKL